MKKSVKQIRFLFVLLGGLLIASCNNDDDNLDGPGTDPVENELNGEINEDLTLDSDVAYNLTGILSVEEGAELTIPAGTRITANSGADIYVVVQKGGQIHVQGTEADPVVMTSQTGNPGDWGGLVILGDAETTAGANATAEVGQLIYGGSNNNDNSGSIDYLIIEGAGAQISPESQYNGLSLYAVGSGTSISNVAIINGSDDGVEFFGGTVSATNLYLENNEDDAVDWTEGWNGTITNTYVMHTIEGFSTAIEADGVNSNPTINNFTAVSTTGGTALQFKVESGATITGLSLTGYDTSIDMAHDGPLSNVEIEGNDADPEMNYTTAATVDINSFDWVEVADLDQALLQGVVTNHVTLDPSVEYELTSSYIIEAGGKLTIPAGTKIMARDGGTDVYIAVMKGAEIDIQGTTENPVVIASENGNAGDWGGLTICGDAPTTAGANATAEVGGFVYGGTNATDNSGSITNLVIIGTGAQINPESQYNGVSFYAVGSGTTVENIAVINGADDGVEFFGGTVSATNLYLENNEDDAVDWTEGWNGTATNVYVKHTIEGFSTAVEADGVNSNPQLVNFTAVSSTGGTALQFKVESGAIITNLHLEGYDTNIDMANDGPLSNVVIDGVDAQLGVDYDLGTPVDITSWNWIDASL